MCPIVQKNANMENIRDPEAVTQNVGICMRRAVATFSHNCFSYILTMIAAVAIHALVATSFLFLYTAFGTVVAMHLNCRFSSAAVTSIE